MTRSRTLFVCALLTAGLVVAGCAEDAAGEAATTPSSATVSATTSTVTPSPSDSYLPPAAAAMEPCPGDGRTFEVSKGETTFSGIRYGKGADVVVLSHQVRSSECELVALAARLANEGFQAVTWTADPFPTAEGLEQIVKIERRRGARRIVLAGASKGATMSLYLAAKLGVDAVVALSPGDFHMHGGDLMPKVARYKGPVMVVATELDTAIAHVPDEAAEVHDGREHIELIMGNGDHGRELVQTRDSPVAGQIVEFLRPLLEP